MCYMLMYFFKSYFLQECVLYSTVRAHAVMKALRSSCFY